MLCGCSRGDAEVAEEGPRRRSFHHLSEFSASLREATMLWISRGGAEVTEEKRVTNRIHYLSASSASLREATMLWISRGGAEVAEEGPEGGPPLRVPGVSARGNDALDILGEARRSQM
jgi:hypothetical protein